MDLVFCVCQLVEKVIEHNTKVFLLFVDLHKAYDSVLRQALWCALQRFCIPDCIGAEGMLATDTVCGE